MTDQTHTAQRWLREFWKRRFDVDKYRQRLPMGKLQLHLLHLLLVLALSLGSIATVQAGDDPPRAHPALLQLAKERPNEKIRVIVQRKAWEQLPDQALQRAGGKVTRDLPIINGFAMELPARAVEALAKSKGVRWISIDAPMFSTQLGNETVRDEFTTISFDNNDGTTIWQSSWVENDPDLWWHWPNGRAGTDLWQRNCGWMIIHIQEATPVRLVPSTFPAASLQPHLASISTPVRVWTPAMKWW